MTAVILALVSLTNSILSTQADAWEDAQREQALLLWEGFPLVADPLSDMGAPGSCQTAKSDSLLHPDL